MANGIRQGAIALLAVAVALCWALPDRCAPAGESELNIPHLSAIEREIDKRVERKVTEQLDKKVDEKIGTRVEEKLERKVDEKLDKELEEKLDKKVDEKLDEKVDEKVDAKVVEKIEEKAKEKVQARQKTNPIKVLPSPGDDISPVETEAIDEAGAKIGRKIEQLAERASYQLGDWIDAKVIYGISWLKLGFSLLAIALVFLSDRVIRALLRWHLRTMTHEESAVDSRRVAVEALRKPLSLFIWVYGVYAALSPLFVHFDPPFGENAVHGVASKAAGIGGAIAIIWLLYRLVRLVDVQLMSRPASVEAKVDDLLASIVGKTVRMAIVTIGGILVVQNLTGIDIAPLLASLGIGGLAVALAAKEPLLNIFGTFTVLFDKPFKVGDRIVVDNYDGFVESVGYRSTRIRTFDGNLISIPNQKVINSAVDNVSQRPHIRWVTDITIAPDTAPLEAERAFEILNEVFENHEGMNPDFPPRIHLTGFNQWGLNIQITAWYHPPEWWAYQGWVHASCMKILKRFHTEGIKLSFPGLLSGPLGDHAHGSGRDPVGTALTRVAGRAA